MRSSTELLQSINKDFYKTMDTPDKFVDFLRELSVAVCKENGTEPPQITLEYLHPSKSGSYTFNKKVIQLNHNNIYRNFDMFKNTNNFYFVFLQVETILHETRHHLQHEKQQFADMENIVKATASLTAEEGGNKLVTDIDYFMAPHEVDARHYAYVRSQENPILKKFSNTTNFMDSETSHRKNPYDFDALLKSKGKKYRPFLKAIKSEVKKIQKQEKGSKEDKSLAVYYKIAPKFKFDDVEKLPQEEIIGIRQNIFQYQSTLAFSSMEYLNELNEKVKEIQARISKLANDVAEGRVTELTQEHQDLMMELAKVYVDIQEANRIQATIMPNFDGMVDDFLTKVDALLSNTSLDEIDDEDESELE